MIYVFHIAGHIRELARIHRRAFVERGVGWRQGRFTFIGLSNRAKKVQIAFVSLNYV